MDLYKRLADSVVNRSLTLERIPSFWDTLDATESICSLNERWLSSITPRYLKNVENLIGVSSRVSEKSAVPDIFSRCLVP